MNAPDLDEQPPVLRFVAGGLAFVALVEELLHLHPPEPVLAVPFTHRALAGLRADGIPVFDLGALARSPERPLQAHAIFDTSAGPLGLAVERCGAQAVRYRPIEHSAPSPFARFVHETFAVDGEPHLHFSPSAFLAALLDG